MAKKSLGWGGEDFFFCWGRMMMLFGILGREIEDGIFRRQVTGLVPRFQRHQDVEDSTMLMN